MKKFGETLDDARLTSWTRLFRELVRMVRETERDSEEVQRHMRAAPQKAARLVALTSGSEWWRYYEMGEYRHVWTAILDLGMGMGFAKSAFRSLQRLDPFELMGDSVGDAKLDPKNPQRSLGAAWSLAINVRAYAIFSKSMNELVRLSANDDESLFAAVGLDPISMYCTPIRRKVVEATFGHDQTFLDALGKALQNPLRMTGKLYGELNICLYVMKMAKQIRWLNEARAEQLFLIRLKDLHLYSSDRRSLIKYIQRFRD